MSSDDNIILRVNNISKCFEMYEKPVHRLFQTLCAGHKKFYNEFWALKDINFEVRKGECVGILGRNGAGKSTLLQIITGTLQPTTGTIDRRGRIAALLELGSGFNPEFTGRENIYMNAAILGLKQDEIAARYQEVVDFADIGEFVNHPVKTYSSGMMVRLAFSVQVMVKPDVLVVDEALAVGDAVFQRKCYAKMQEMIQAGMTLLFVSHDTETVKQTCQRAIVLDNHQIRFDGNAEDAVVNYLRMLFPEDPPPIPSAEAKTESESAPPAENEFVLIKNDLQHHAFSWGTKGGIIDEIKIFGLESPNILRSPRRIRICISAHWSVEHVSQLVQKETLEPNMIVGIRLSDVKNTVIYGTNNCLEGDVKIPIFNGKAVVEYELDIPELIGGDIFVTAALSVGNMNAHVHLVWDDLAVVINNVAHHRSDGLCYFNTTMMVKE